MREEYREANRGVGWVIMWVVVILVVIAGLGAAGWAIGVAVSGPKGQGDGIVERNSAENWLDAQARFEENYAEIEATQFKIVTAANALEDAKAAGEPTKTLEQNLQGTVNFCASLVSDYNADARNFLREDFKAEDLPDSIDVQLTCSIPTP